jgi:hypothetical protein
VYAPIAHWVWSPDGWLFGLGVLSRRAPDNIDIFEPGGAIDSQVAQVFTEETEAFAEKENRDEGKDDDRDHGVAAKEIFDRAVGKLTGTTALTTGGGGGDVRRGDFHRQRMQTRRATGKGFRVTFV